MADMQPEQLRPEADVIAAIDALVDEQLTHPERFHVLGDRRACELCGGEWHGLPGTGPAMIHAEGHPGAESYPTVGNGGEPGCPGAYAISAQRIRWRHRYTYPGPYLWSPSRPDRDWRDRWAPRPPEPTCSGYGPRPPERHTCRADRNGVCVWADCPNNTMLDDTIFAMQRYQLGCPPRPADAAGPLETVEVTGPVQAPQIRYWDAAMREIRNPLERFRATMEQIMEAIGQIVGIPVEALHITPPTVEAPTGRIVDGLISIRPGEALPEIPSIFDENGNLRSLEGFQPIGYVDQVDDTVISDADGPLCDASHCYCDNPHRCAWNRTDGPARPNRREVYGEPPRQRGAREARRRARRRRTEPEPTCAGSAGDGYDDGLGISIGDIRRNPPWVVYRDEPGQGGGYNLEALTQLRQHIWEARRPRREINMHIVIGGNAHIRCTQCQRHLEPDHALVGYPPGSYWCQECADNWTQAHHAEPGGPVNRLHAVNHLDMHVGDLFTFEGMGMRRILRVTAVDGDTFTADPIDADEFRTLDAWPPPMQFPRY